MSERPSGGQRLAAAGAWTVSLSEKCPIQSNGGYSSERRSRTVVVDTALSAACSPSIVGRAAVPVVGQDDNGDAGAVAATSESAAAEFIISGTVLGRYYHRP